MKSLIDTYGRDHTYLRISVTERCNLRCTYCMPAHGIQLKPLAELLTYTEIERLVEIFSTLGVCKIRITGGEPLVRPGIEELCKRLSVINGIETLSLSTNGTMLQKKAKALRDAGVMNINISLDSLRGYRFEKITLRSGHIDVLRGIESAIKEGFPSIKINAVIIRGFNDDELSDFVELARALSVSVRFIEYMPFPGNNWRQEEFISFYEMKERIEKKYSLTPVMSSEPVPGPAKEYRIDNSEAKVGFITTMSEHFCGSCNRIRLTADGRLRTCLFANDGVDLKRLLRVGASRDVIEDSIRSAVILKWEKHPGHEELMTNQDREMTAIGG
jgi:molybdenum cofactor biosynthesis protein A